MSCLLSATSVCEYTACVLTLHGVRSDLQRIYDLRLETELSGSSVDLNQHVWRKNTVAMADQCAMVMSAGAAVPVGWQSVRPFAPVEAWRCSDNLDLLKLEHILLSWEDSYNPDVSSEPCMCGKLNGKVKSCSKRGVDLACVQKLKPIWCCQAKQWVPQMDK